MTQYSLRDGLVGCWRFNENIGVAAHDTSGYGNDGLLSGSPVPTWTTGIHGKALNFNGPDTVNAARIKVLDASELRMKQGITFLAWIYVSSLPAAAGQIFSKNGYYEYSFNLQHDGRLQFIYYVGANIQNSYSSGTISTGVWHFVAVVLDAGTVTFYIDGATSGTSAMSAGTPVTSTSDLYIGASNVFLDATSYYPFVGVIDEPLVYNRALSLAEISLLRFYDSSSLDPAWLIQYHNGAKYVPLEAVLPSGRKIDALLEELDGHEEANFIIPNNAANRAFILTDQSIQYCFLADYVYHPIYTSILKAPAYTLTKLTCTCYNPLYELLQRRSFTGSYTSTAANTILTAITGGGGGTFTDTFGDTSIEDGLDYELYGYIGAVKYQMKNVSGATITDVYVYGSVNNSCYYKIAIYSDNSNAPNALLGSSDEVNVTNTDPAWIQFHFSTPVSVSALANYWLAWIGSDMLILASSNDGSSDQNQWGYANYGDGIPDPFPAIVGTANVYMSVYAVISWGTGSPTCPTTAVSVDYEDKNSYDCCVQLANNLKLDFWRDDSNLFNIGVRNSCKLALTLDEGFGQTATDESGNGNDATIYPAVSSFTFGRTNTGTTDLAASSDTKYANRWQAGASGTISKITWRGKRSSSGKVRCAIYADNAGSPGALIAQTSEATVSTSTGWVDFPFTTTVSVVNGTYYWLSVICAAAYTCRYNNTTGTMNYNGDTYSDGFADPFGVPSTYATRELCIYASGSTLPASWVAGKYGSALQFDGSSQYAENASPTDFPVGTSAPFSVAFWVYLPSTPSNGASFLYFSTAAGDGQGRGIVRYNNSIYFHGGNTDVQATVDYDVGIWQFIVCTFDGTVLKFYKNAVQVGSGTPALVAATAALYIAKNFLGWHHWLPAGSIIDEILIYNRSLSSAEIAFFYNQNEFNCRRGVDRSKKRTQVKCRGIDDYGNKTSYTAGTGDDITVVDKTEPTDDATLELQAEQLLDTLTEYTGTPMKFPINVAALWHAGDSIPLHVTRLAMDDIFRIQKITKNSTTATVEFEKTTVLYQHALNNLKASALEQLANRKGVAFTRSDSGSPPSSPLKGDMWFQTDTNQYYYYDGSNWQQFQPV